jgi:hypothetical protein
MFKHGDAVMDIDQTSIYCRYTGIVTQDQSDQTVRVGINCKGEIISIIYPVSSLRKVTPAEEYRKGDRVKIIKSTGPDAGREGTVYGPKSLTSQSVNVLLDGEKYASGHHFADVELIDPAPRPTPHRTEGARIKPEDVKVGDVISYHNVVVFLDGKETSQSSGTVGSVNEHTIRSQSGRVLWDANFQGHSDLTLITGVRDDVREALYTFPKGAILSFHYGKMKDTAVALKVGNKWHMIGSTGPIVVTSDELRYYIGKSDDSYEILESGK